VAGIYGRCSRKDADSVSEVSIPNMDLDYVVGKTLDVDGLHIKHFTYRWSPYKIGQSRSGDVMFAYVDFICDVELPGVERGAGMSLSGYLAEGYERLGEGLWIHLNGSWAACAYVRSSRSLVIAADRLGVVGLYYAAGHDKFCFSTSMLALAKNEPELRKLNLEGVVEFLTVGYAQACRTYVSGVELVPAGSTVTWRDGRAEIRKYWEPNLTCDPAMTDPNEVADRLDVLLDKAVQRYVAGAKIGVALSGGLDSRQLASRSKGNLCLSGTWGDATSADMVCAASVSEALGVPHVTCNYLPEETGIHYLRWLDINDGFIWTPEYQIVAKALASQCQAAFFGMLGDAIRGHCACPAPPEIWKESKVRAEVYFFSSIGFLQDREHAKALGTVIPRELYGKPRRNFDSLFDQVQGPDLYKRSYWYNMTSYQRRRTFVAIGAARTYLELRPALVDTDLLDFVLTVPSWMFAHSVDIYQLALVRNHPHLAFLPHSRGSNYVLDSKTKWSKRWLKRRLWGTLPVSWRQRLVETSLNRLPSSTTRSVFATYMADVLSKDVNLLVDMGILDGDFAKGMLDSHFKGRYSRHSLFNKLVALGSVIQNYGLALP
jgi:hypothetical protein